MAESTPTPETNHTPEANYRPEATSTSQANDKPKEKTTQEKTYELEERKFRFSQSSVRWDLGSKLILGIATLAIAWISGAFDFKIKQSEFAKKQLDVEVSDLNQRKDSLTRQIDSSKRHIDSLTSQNTKLSAIKSELERKNIGLESENSSLEGVNQKLETRNASLEGTNHNLEGKNASLERDILEYKTKQAQIEQKISALLKTRDSLSSAVQLLYANSYKMYDKDTYIQKLKKDLTESYERERIMRIKYEGILKEKGKNP